MCENLMKYTHIQNYICIYINIYYILKDTASVDVLRVTNDGVNLPYLADDISRKQTQSVIRDSGFGTTRHFQTTHADYATDATLSDDGIYDELTHDCTDESRDVLQPTNILDETNHPILIEQINDEHEADDLNSEYDNPTTGSNHDTYVDGTMEYNKVPR